MKFYMDDSGRINLGAMRARLRERIPCCAMRECHRPLACNAARGYWHCPKHGRLTLDHAIEQLPFTVHRMIESEAAQALLEIRGMADDARRELCQ